MFDQQLTTAPRFEILTTSKQYRLDTPDTSGGNRSGESAKEIQKMNTSTFLEDGDFLTKEDFLSFAKGMRKPEAATMDSQAVIQHPFNVCAVIVLADLIDLIRYELEVIEDDELGSRKGVDLFNEMLVNMHSETEKQLLIEAINDAFI
uniref:hypothetical protein n=1 Tax=Pseudomonadaceae TaxID=135621 RepID=UPI00155DBBD8|nr:MULTISPECIES: hypothetical protein [Pseudomonas]